MAKSPAEIKQDVEQKVSNEALLLPAPLVYTSPTPFEGNIHEMEGGAEIEEALIKTCIEGNVEALKEILEKNNISVNARLYEGMTLLIRVLCNPIISFRMVDFLLNEPKMDVSVVDERDRTALNCVLQIHSEFKNANYRIAHRLIVMGANVDEISQYGSFTPLLYAWTFGNQEAANQLVSLGANIEENEHLFNILLTHDGFGWEGSEGIPQQIELSYLERARQLGLGVGDACFRFMGKNQIIITKEMGKFLFAEGSLAEKAFSNSCKMAFEALSKQFPAPAPKKLLPIPRSLFFMVDERNILSKEMINELAWQQHEQQYNHDFPERAKYGYGPGAMVVYKPYRVAQKSRKRF